MLRERLLIASGDLAYAEAAMRRLADSGFPSHRVAIIARQGGKERALRGRYPGAQVHTVTTAGGMIGGLVGVAVADRLAHPPGPTWPLVVAALIATVLGALLGRLLAAGRSPMPWRELPRSGYLVVALGNARDLAHAETILAAWGDAEPRAGTSVTSPGEQRAPRASSGDQQPPGTPAARTSDGPKAGPAVGRARTLVRDGEHDGFSRHEWQRLIFLRWLYRQGRLHDWIECGDQHP